MPIVLISESLLRRSTVTDGRLLRDRVLSVFCVRMNVHKRTFRIATSVAGEQFRMNLGYWPLMSVEERKPLHAARLSTLTSPEALLQDRFLARWPHLC